jgi:predicted permease
MNLRDWRLRVRAILFPSTTERDLEDELAFHVEREAQKLIAEGKSLADARAAAQTRFGSTLRAADHCRDARRTGFVDDLVRDVRFAVRTLKRAPLAALTIVGTVALGLGLVAVAFTLLNTLLFRIDSVPNVHEMFTVKRPESTKGDRPAFTRAQFDALRRDSRAFTDSYAEVSQVDGRADGRLAFGTFVTGNFSEVLGVQAALGRALTSADDAPSTSSPVIVLSHRGWDRLFARDRSVVGRGILINGSRFEVIGVMPDTFRGLSVVPDDYWAPLSMLGRVRPVKQGGDESVDVDIVGRLRPGVSADTARAELAVWDARATSEPKESRAPSGILLLPRNGTVQLPQEALLVTGPLFFAFGLILLIGCANVASLLLGRAVARQREVGIRISLGAPRRRIVRQLLTESLLLALVAAGAGFLLSRVVLQGIVHVMLTTMPKDLGDVRLEVPLADWRVALFLVAGAFVSTAIFGLVPALHATRVDPIATLRGGIGVDSRRGSTRDLLIGLQVSASVVLLICSFVFLRSALAASNFAPGLRTADTVIVQIPNEETRAAVVSTLLVDPIVADLAASSPDGRRVLAEAANAKGVVAFKGVSSSYFGVFEIPVVRGRGFAAGERSADSGVAIVSETAARVLWPNGDAVGEVISVAPPDAPPASEVEAGVEPRSYRVAGVARDVPGLRISPLEKAVLYVPTTVQTPGTLLALSVRGDPQHAREVLLDRLTTIDPGMSRAVLTMRTLAGMEEYFLRMGFGLTVMLGGLALALTLSGLFSVLSYFIEQRRREIGVRMAIGATARDIIGLVMAHSLRPVGLGLIVGAGSTAGLAGLLLASPSAAPIAQVIRVLDPLAYAASLGLIIAACVVATAVPATRAARLDPTGALRQD